MVDVVSVTIAHPLDPEEASALGVAPVALSPGDVVTMPVGSVRRLYVTGYIERTAALSVMLGGARPAEAPPSLRAYVGEEAPVVPAGTAYVWMQTGTGSDGTGTTIWYEDGTS